MIHTKQISSKPLQFGGIFKTFFEIENMWKIRQNNVDSNWFFFGFFGMFLFLFKVNNEIFSHEHGEKILLKIKPFLHRHTSANYPSNIAKNTSKNCGNIVLDIAKETNIEMSSLERLRYPWTVCRKYLISS